MKRDTPLVSIGVPTHNRAALLTRTLDSLLGQEYSNLEILVSDNASGDETPNLCRALSEADDRVQYSRNDRDIGALANFSKTLELSRGDYFMWAADDDWLEPDFVATLVHVLEADGGIALAAAEARYVLEDGQMLPYFPEGEYFYSPRETGLVGRLMDVVDHNYGNLFYGVYRRSALLANGGKTVLSCITATTMNEIPVYLQVVAHGGIKVVPDQLLYKTTTLPTYRQAAAEYGWLLAEEPGAGICLRKDPAIERQADRDPPAALVPAWSGHPGFRESLLGGKRYHDEALRDILAALVLLPLGPEDHTLLSEYCRLRIYEHLFELSAKECGIFSAGSSEI